MIRSELYVLRVGNGFFLQNSGVNGVTWVVPNPYHAQIYYGAAEAEHDRQDLAKGRWPFAEEAHIDIAFVHVERVEGCGCCGRHVEIRHTKRGWRCEKHLERNPCIVDGCRRTYKGPAGNEFLCGKHFREAPKYMRDRIRAIERKGKKFGWNKQLGRMHSAAWRLIVRSIEAGRTLDQAEIDKMFGWDQ